MPGSHSSPKISRQLRGELEIVTAMAREEILDAHVVHLLELIELTRGRISARRVLEIYLRLHQIDPEMARKIANKALATLGHRRETAGPIHLDESRSEPPHWDPPPGLFRRIRRRLRGRVDPELRRTVELHTGRTQVALLRVHVENTLRYVRVLAPEMPTAAVVAIYAEGTGLRRSVAETVYSMTLDRMSTPALVWLDPEHPFETGAVPEPDPEPVLVHAARAKESPVRIMNRSKNRTLPAEVGYKIS